MMAMAVNCLVTDARRKFVCSSILCSERRSVTPYSRCNTICPPSMTMTAAPGDAVVTVANNVSMREAGS
jgi:hypothetical protein